MSVGLGTAVAALLLLAVLGVWAALFVLVACALTVIGVCVQASYRAIRRRRKAGRP